MILNRLSQNGYYANDIFPAEVVSTLLDLCKTFSGDDIHDVRGNPDLGLREVHMLFKKNSNLEQTLISYIENQIKDITPDFGQLYGFELWRDHKGWINPLHIDCLEAQNIMIVYLDNQSNINGTEYIENNIKYSAEYKQNTGLVLLNSDTIKHGMVGEVNETRHCLYTIWITKSRILELNELNKQ